MELCKFVFWIMSVNIVHTLADHPARNQIVKLELYYESMCPDCTQFVQKQLIPVWKRIGGTYLNVELIPYGNAATTKDGHGKIKIRCQHGVKECRGNIMHACALKYFTRSLPLEFISCTEQGKRGQDPTTRGPSCAESFGLDFNPVKTCMEGNEGFELLVANGERTNKLVPSHEYVPWMLFNGIYTKDDNDHAEQDLLSVVCKHLSPPPTECNQI